MKGPDDKKAGDEQTPPETRLYTTPADPNQTIDTSVPLPGGEETLGPLKDRFQLLSELGQGGMGIVYKARDNETGGLVALKMLKPEIAADATLLGRFKDELLLARKITHKNVCRTHDLHRIGQTAVIAMEYIEGESLRRLLRRVEGLSIRHGLKIARQVLSGLGEAHAQGVTHRDMKPENIMIDLEGNAKIMDFGIARSIEAKEKTTEGVTGTPAYMSPEQAEGKAVDHRTDIYAIGLILYEMFTGEATFRGDTAISVAHKQIHEPPPNPREIEPYLPNHIERAILKCLEKNPKKRYQSIEQLEAALFKKSEEAQPATAVELPSHLTSHRRSDFALLGLGLVGLVVYLLGVTWTQPESNLRIKFTRQMLVQKAREELSGRGWEPVQQASSFIGGRMMLKPYRYLGERAGYAEARNGLMNDYHPLMHGVRFRTGSGRDVPFANVEYDLDGMLYDLDIPIKDWIPEGARLDRAEARALALREITENFSVEQAQLSLKSDEPLQSDNRAGYSFRWLKKESSGIQWEYKATVFDRVTSLSRKPVLPEDYTPPESGLATWIPGVITFLLWLLALVVIISRKLYQEMGFRETLMLAGIGLVAALGLAIPLGLAMAFDLGAGGGVFLFLLLLVVYVIFFSIMTITFLTASNFLSRRRKPHLMVTLMAVLTLRPKKGTTGLAVSRGFAVGLLVAGLITGIRWVGLTTGLTWPRLGEFEQVGGLFLNSPVPGLAILGTSLFGGLSMTLMFTLVFALITRRVSSLVLLVLSGGVLQLLLASIPRPIDAAVLLVIAVMGAAFAWVLVSFDALTLAATILTVALVMTTYPLAEMYKDIGNWQFWLLLLLWGVAFLWGLVTGYKPLWSSFGRRLGEIVD